jgi:hypothetical protein
MNEAMSLAWLEISQMLGEPTREELDVFLRTWQRAIQAEREECLKIADDCVDADMHASMVANAIRARGETK